MCVIRELLGKGSFGTGIFNTIDGVIGTGNGIQIFPSEYGALVLTLPDRRLYHARLPDRAHAVRAAQVRREEGSQGKSARSAGKGGGIT